MAVRRGADSVLADAVVVEGLVERDDSLRAVERAGRELAVLAAQAGDALQIPVYEELPAEDVQLEHRARVAAVPLREKSRLDAGKLL